MHEQPEPTSAVKPCVLVVDDEEMLTRVVGRGLTHAGYEVAIATSGEAALAHLDRRRFDVLLTDIHMPRMRGDELQRLARQKDPDLAVLLMTAAQDTASAVECLKEGVYDYLIKPAPLADVAARVNKALERRRLEIENRDYRANLEQRVAEQAERIRRVVQRSLESLIQALEAKDEYTRDHSARVSELTTALAARMAIGDSNAIARLRVTALLHDIGKIGVPEAILNKPGKLDEEEMAQVRRHPELGEAILRPLLDDPEMLAVVRHHHERWDGGGYPDGLAGAATPLGARIVGVAAAYDAMTSARAYRTAMEPAQALAVLREGAGGQWDPKVVAALLEMAESDGLPDSAPHDLTESPEAGATIGAHFVPSNRRPVVRIGTDLDEKAAERLRFKVGALLGNGENRFVLDLRQVGYVDGEGVQLLYLLHLRAQEAGGQMAIRDAPDHILIALRHAKLMETLCLERSSPQRPTRLGGSGRRAA